VTRIWWQFLNPIFISHPPLPQLCQKNRRSKLAEHSQHLERQHADAFGPVDDAVDIAADADTAETAAETAGAGAAVAAVGGDAGGEHGTGASLGAGTRSQRGGGDAEGGGGGGRAVSPSQRRVAQLLRIETEHGAASLAGDALSPNKQPIRERGSSMSPSPRRLSTSRESFVVPPPQKEDAMVQTSPKVGGLYKTNPVYPKPDSA
jgi:hypothetical protein